VIVHGLAEHGGRYRKTAEALAAEGLAVYAGDLRAHGMSADPPRAGRVHVDRFDDYLDDVSAFVDLARSRHGDRPLFVLGHSMGGLVSILYTLTRPGNLSGAIISSPLLGTHPQFKPPALLKLLVGLLAVLAPRLRVESKLDVEAISRDPAVVRAYVEDPLVSSKVSARWYREAMRSVRRAHRAAATLGVPMLLMQSGDDRLVDPSAPERWADAAPPGRVELVVWDGLYHEMLNEPEQERVRARILQWLQEQLPATAKAGA
jgi:lysophospholipase